MATALDQFAIPGDPNFPLNQSYEAPHNKNDAETLRQYIAQVRQELALRLLARIYAGGNTPSKVCFPSPGRTSAHKPPQWWLSFTKRRFMGKSL